MYGLHNRVVLVPIRLPVCNVLALILFFYPDSRGGPAACSGGVANLEMHYRYEYKKKPSRRRLGVVERAYGWLSMRCVPFALQRPIHKKRRLDFVCGWDHACLSHDKKIKHVIWCKADLFLWNLEKRK